ncbi:hypothetical protein MPC4_60132 [Methylocella tundrae]|uniref:Uncharacterized protein n=1 Tax=Methylocella tundrae TaxID=227605 RepID=A0A8B6MAK6_METTU|nr:hypothetical protein MPC4_60132 [Methylocella tundrae]
MTPLAHLHDDQPLQHWPNGHALAIVEMAAVLWTTQDNPRGRFDKLSGSMTPKSCRLS